MRGEEQGTEVVYIYMPSLFLRDQWKAEAANKLRFLSLHPRERG